MIGPKWVESFSLLEVERDKRVLKGRVTQGRGLTNASDCISLRFGVVFQAVNAFIQGV